MFFKVPFKQKNYKKKILKYQMFIEIINKKYITLLKREIGIEENKKRERK